MCFKLSTLKRIKYLHHTRLASGWPTGVFIRWNGIMVEWNGGMEQWSGLVVWNGGIVE